MLISRNIQKIDLLFSFSSSFPEQLSCGEQKQMQKFYSLPRYKNWMLGRSALKNLLSTLDLDSDTSKLKFPNHKFSLSHCSNLAVAAGLTSKQQLIEGVGVDIEFNRSLSDNHAKFFLSSEERKIIQSDNHRLRLWTIKEALFKSDPNNNETVLRDYKIENPIRLQGEARNNTGRSFYYYCEKLSNNIKFKIKSDGWISCALSYATA